MPGNPFPIGFWLLQIPFLFLGTLVDWLLSGQSDGYSPICVSSYYFGILFYLCAGLTLLFLLLRSIGHSLGLPGRRCDWTAWVVTLGMWPTTSLAYYTFSAVSHTASFMASCAFLLAWWHAKDSASIPRWLLTGLCGGLLILTRWQLALFMLIPIVYDALWFRLPQPRRRRGAAAWLASRAAAASVALVSFLPQALEWKIIYNRFLTIPQGKDWFDFPPQHAFDVLFSTHHGWFVWTPITLLGVAGLFYGCFRVTRLCIPLLTALALQVAVIGSLRTAWHGYDSFSIRALTECVPLVAIGVALLLLFGTPLLRRTVYGLGVLCAIYSLTFAAQYRLDLVPKNDRLTTSELIADKLLLQRTLKRKELSSNALHLLDSNVDEALELASRAARDFGDDRALLEVILQAQKRKGDVRGAAETEEKLSRLLEKRLF